jgi:hypothetical protein
MTFFTHASEKIIQIDIKGSFFPLGLMFVSTDMWQTLEWATYGAPHEYAITFLIIDI